MHLYVIELKLRNNGGKEAAIKQIQDRQYLEPFKADKQEVVGLGIELDEEGKGILDWEMVNEEWSNSIVILNKRGHWVLAQKLLLHKLSKF